MANYASHLRKTPKSQMEKDRDDQVANSAGGFVYSLDDWKALNRFLILGCDSGTYYASEKSLTIKNAAVVDRLLKSGNGRKVIDRVVEISTEGRAIKNDPALLVMAMCISCDDEITKQYAVTKLPEVARIATFLFTFVDYANSLRRWGRTLRKAVANWYNTKDAKSLAYQVTKYQSRTKEGSQTWSHLDLLRKAHVKPVSPAHNTVFNYIAKGWDADRLSSFEPTENNPFNPIYAHEEAKRAKSVSDIVMLIEEYNIPRESIPTQFLNSPEVWKAMLPNMPLMAMIRNLATMTRAGVLGPMVDGNRIVIEKLKDREVLKKARVHPISILAAMKTYAQGKGMKSDNTWTPVQSIVDALDRAFYDAFDLVEPTGKRIMLAVDCSGSMSSPIGGSMPYLTSLEVAAALALVTAKTETGYLITGFTNASSGPWGGYSFPSSSAKETDGIKELGISPRMRMDSVCSVMSKFAWGGTDTALPMLWAAQKNLKVDTFVVITDNETWAGGVKADEALRRYRQSSGIKDAKLAVIGTTATEFTIADPKDPNMMDLIGCSTDTPTVLADFIRGDI